jgi:acetyl-CoA/propionyl-CoA carboxylase biotin carboxyl carrier protein
MSGPASGPFGTVLVANRGEIAVRVIRTLRRLGIRSATVYSDADANARHVAEADVAVRIGPAAAVRSYLDIDAVIDAARRTGAGAVHPGYGFLAENAGFARACGKAGLVFVGPPAEAIETMGDKIRAKRAVQAAGVPVVPGRHDPGMSDADLVAAAVEVGFPVLLKPSAGGGGKGMLRVADADGIATAIASARRQAAAAFGDDTLLLERYVSAPRHIEVQILADAHGSVVHLGERECSLQRRHQKIVEEAPSVLLDDATRERIGAAAVRVAAACGYVGAGTVEFIVDGERPEEFFFLEMNTRLQVEHPVTELVTGLDLVEQQLRCAAGERLRFDQSDVVLRGHAVEARVYAEDPARGFLPTGGRVLALHEPDGDGVRVDSGLAPGVLVGSDYDPMLAKVIAWAPDRAGALARLDAALAGTAVLGLTTNIGFLRRLLADPDVAAGRLDTDLVTRRGGELAPGGVPRRAVVAAALGRLAERDPGPSAEPFAIPSGWRLGAPPAWTHDRLQAAGELLVDVRMRGRASAAQVQVGDDGVLPASARLDRDRHRLTVVVDGQVDHWWYVPDGEVLWIGAGGEAWALREIPARARPDDGPNGGPNDGPNGGSDGGPDGAHGPLLAPLPGTVTAVHVAPGDPVEAGQPVVTVEAMKMEHVVRARGSGVLRAVRVSPGQRVALDAELAVVDPAPAVPPGEATATGTATATVQQEARG